MLCCTCHIVIIRCSYEYNVYILHGIQEATSSLMSGLSRMYRFPAAILALAYNVSSPFRAYSCVEIFMATITSKAREES